MSEDDVLNLIGDSNGFVGVNHNPINYEKYKKFQEGLDGKFSQLEKERTVAERKANLKKWDQKLSKPWNEANIKTVKDRAAAEAAIELIKKDKFGSFFITGESGSGKTFLALAIVRVFIGGGAVSPSQVYHLSEDEFMNISKSGFRYQENLNQLLNKKNKLYIIDNVGNKMFYSDEEKALWGQFLDFVSRNDLKVIFTSKISHVGFRDILSESSQAKFSYLIENKTITMSGVVRPPDLRGPITKEEEEKMIKVDKELNKVNSFSKEPPFRARSKRKT